MWAFIGSGASIDAGGPSWQSLIELTMLRLDLTLRQDIKADTIFSSALNKKDYPKCFSRIEHYCNRDTLDTTVKNVIDRINVPGKMINLLSSWPFKGYITTNYDTLIEKAISNLGELGWSPVGNTKDEVRKISGNVSKVIWHVHGCAAMSSEKSCLVLTEEDYENFYLEESPVISQLKALMSQTRVVFLGFGFEDQEIMRLLKKIGKMTDPARPVYAFLHGNTGSQYDAKRSELFDKYNVDLIPYKNVDESHTRLLELLDFYTAFIIRRSLKFGQPERRCPSYDPEATGLLIYNELCLRDQMNVSNDILEMLLVSRILVLLSRRSMSIDSLLEDLADKVRAMKRNLAQAELGKLIERIIDKLINASAPVIMQVDGTSAVCLTKTGIVLVKQHAATAQRLSEQFSSSLSTRAASEFPGDAVASLRIAKAAECFLKDCIDRRSLGVAMLKNATRDDLHSFHMTALLQSLPEFMEQLSSQEEAISLSKLVQGVLSVPSDAEEKYIGLCLQARFGIHLLGYDADALRTRVNELRDTLFLVDSTTIIPFLAISSIGNNSARKLIDGLKSMNSSIATTDLLAEEAAEHARYALKKVGSGQGRPTVETLKALTGRAGERSNAFLEGFVVEVVKGKIIDFSNYLAQICGFPIQTTLSSADIQYVLSKEKIYCYALNEWDGFDQIIWNERDERQLEIAKIRTERRTYRHERQVKAEAEALIIIKYLRDKTFKISGRPVSNAFFISHTRIIDELSGHASNITMRPEAILQWLATITPVSVDELRVLTSNLLFELTEYNLDIIDKSKLRLVFSPLIDASKATLNEEVLTHRELISEKYGEQGAKAFSDISDLDAPIVFESYYTQKTADLERQQLEASKAEIRARISGKERTELERLRLEKKQRQQKAKQQKRKNASRLKKKHKK
jgi:hypothetical protein